MARGSAMADAYAGHRSPLLDIVEVRLLQALNGGADR